MNVTEYTYQSVKGLNAAEKFENIYVGMTVEYADCENDMDSGNYGKVIATDLDVARKAFTGVPFYRYLVLIELCNGRRVTISAGQVLAITLDTMEAA